MNGRALPAMLAGLLTLLGTAANTGGGTDPAAETASPTTVVDAWLERQTRLETWSATVVQTRTIKSLARPLESKGLVWFRQPNRFRWQLGDPPRTIAVRTEDELVILYPRLKQAERFSLGAGIDPAWRQALSLLEVGFPSDRESFYEGYEPLAATRTGDTWRLVLRPAGEQARRLVREVRFELAAADYLLLATELVFADGSTMRNDFRDHRLDPEIDPELFEINLNEDWSVSRPLEGR